VKKGAFLSSEREFHCSEGQKGLGRRKIERLFSIFSLDDFMRKKRRSQKDREKRGKTGSLTIVERNPSPGPFNKEREEKREPLCG